MSPIRSAFQEFSPYHCTVTLGSSATATAQVMGYALLTVAPGSTARTVKLTGVLLVADLTCQLLPVSNLVALGVGVGVKHKSCHIHVGNTLLATGVLDGNLYLLCTILPPSQSAPSLNHCLSASYSISLCTRILRGHISRSSGHDSGLRLWHHRIAHVDPEAISSMVQHEVVLAVTLPSKTVAWAPCNACQLGKAPHFPFPTSTTTRHATLLHLLHSDVVHPFHTPSVSGARYFGTFIDDASRWVATYPMLAKSDNLTMVCHYLLYAEGHVGSSLVTLQTDNGGEYAYSPFAARLHSHGIMNQRTVPHKPKQNCVAERLNRTIINVVRAMLLHRDS